MRTVSIPFASGLTLLLGKSDQELSGRERLNPLRIGANSPSRCHARIDELLNGLNPLRIGANSPSEFKRHADFVRIVSIPFASGLTLLPGNTHPCTYYGLSLNPLRIGANSPSMTGV